MAIPSRGIGWGTEENLLWQISKQIERLTQVTGNAVATTSSTSTTAAPTTTTTTTLPVYRVFTALLTQSGSSSLVSLGFADVIKGVTYLFDGGSDYDFSNVGGPIYPENYSFIATETAQPNDLGTSEWIYNTGAPTVIVLENTLEGTISFHYSTEGNYVVVNSIPWDQAKTTFQLEQGFSDFGSFVPSFVPITGGGKTFLTFSNTGTAGSVPPNILPPSNGVLNKSLVEIKVYN